MWSICVSDNHAKGMSMIHIPIRCFRNQLISLYISMFYFLTELKCNVPGSQTVLDNPAAIRLDKPTFVLSAHVTS